MRIRRAITIDASRATTWSVLADIASHVDWMRDAESLTFTSAQREGVGTQFDCRTKVGPFSTIDRMTVTAWDAGARIGVRHTGIVTGLGCFTLEDGPDAATVVTWDEELRFPARLGGAVTGWLARPVLSRLWAGNLSRLRAQVEAKSVS